MTGVETPNFSTEFQLLLGAADRPGVDNRLKKNLGPMLDVPLRVTVELGGTRLRIEDVLALTDGSVLELDRLAGEPLDIKIGDKLIGRGTAVVVNGKLGVRIIELLDDVRAGAAS